MIQDGNQSLIRNKTASLWIQRAAAMLFFTAVAWNFLTIPLPAFPKPHPVLLQSLLKGTDVGYTLMGHEYSIFKSHLPPSGKFSIILDHTFSPYGGSIEKLYTAQVYFTPILLNPYPGEAGALVYCSSVEMADYRMKDSGYRLAVPLAEGKALAVKI